MADEAEARTPARRWATMFMMLLPALSAPSASTAQSGIVYEPSPVSFAFTGDINLGTRTLPNGIPPDSGRNLLTGALPFLRGDLVVGNFEGVLSDSGYSLKCGPPPDTTAASATKKTAPKRTASKHCYSFATPTWLASRLVEAGFTHLNLANNHANDFGPEWRDHTEETFGELGITTYGPFPRSLAITPVFHEGGMTLVGVVGFTSYPFANNLLDIPASAAVIESIRPLVDILIVTFHGGTEGSAAVRTGTGPEYLAGEPRGDLRKWARAVIDAGADAVVGHGPHVLRGVEFYNSKPIFYSLGNFVNYRGFHLDGPLGITAVLQLTLAGDGTFESARMIPMIQLAEQGPRPDSSGAAVELLQRVTRLDFPTTGARIDTLGAILPP
jgi:hypothetical protein